MHAFVNNVGVIDEACECPRQDFCVCVDVGRICVDNECGVVAGDVGDLVFERAFGELCAYVGHFYLQ